MKCSKCQFENADGMHFCGKCGTKLGIYCPQCNFGNPPEHKFCGSCGYDLGLSSEGPGRGLSFDEKLNKIQKYLPEGLTEKILSQRSRIEGERKQVTVMFADMEGFTRLSEKLDPEEAYAVMDRVYEILIHKVHAYEGTVNEMTGDGIMALFGAPIALEDATQRAILSALSIHREISKFSDKLQREIEDTPPLRMRIGLHTGPVVVGALGNDLRVDFKAVGDTVNLASRMEELAEPGAVYITEAAFRIVEGFFRFEGLGKKQVKGKDEPVKVYRVIAPSSRRTRFDVSAERGLTPFVGRGRELELLLDGYSRVKRGRGQAFSIISEAGVGKSRLLYEFRKKVIGEDVTFLEGKCLSYSRNIAYHPVMDILKANFDILRGDEESLIKTKVKTGLHRLGVDEGSTLIYLLEILAVKDSGIDKIAMSPEAKRGRIFEALRKIVLMGAEIRPLIVAIEDLHWIDKSSEETLRYLIENISGARVLLLFTYRPDFVHTWGGKSYHNQINLNRLSNRESLSMVANLLGTENIARDLEEMILEKTEGIPFFVEEFLRSLKDLHIIKKDGAKYILTENFQTLTIPSTIQDVIMARVDPLPENAKEVLQTGAVIEREFSYELIKRVANLSEQELLFCLSVLKDSELLYERGLYPRSSYIFKHALTRNVVCDSILNKKKKRLHEKIGQAMEELYKNSIDEFYGSLAGHYMAAENYASGAEYSKLAGKRSLRAASFDEATEHAQKRVSCLMKLPETEETQRKMVEARTTLASYLINVSKYVESKEAVAPIADLALKLHCYKYLPRIYAVLGAYCFWVEEKYADVLQYLLNSSKIAEQEGDYLSLFFADFNMGWCLTFNCEFEKGLECFDRCFKLSVAAKNAIGISYTNGVASSINYGYKGKIEDAYRKNKKLLETADESGDIFIKAMAYTTYGMTCFHKGFLDEAEKHLIKGADCSSKASQVGWEASAFGFLGHLYSALEEYRKARESYSKSIMTLRRASMLPSLRRMCQVGLIKARVLQREQDVKANELARYHEKNNFKVLEGRISRDIGEIFLKYDDDRLPDAALWITKAIDADHRNEMMWSLGCDYALQGQLFRRQGKMSQARETMARAIGILKDCGADGWVEKYEAELTAL